MSNTTIRPYEMSVWSLRDSYLATLKAPGIENKGHIEDPKMKLSVDGTQELTFKIPMYYFKDNEMVENPYWYDAKHGLLMTGLRKIKVIFNKGTDDEEIFEFLVVKVDEEHDNENKLYCNVEASGLAFQELGKKGYKISLNPDDYVNEVGDFEDKIYEQAEKENWSNEKINQELKNVPLNNINYWCDKVFKNSDWYYTIQMEWGSYDGFLLKRIVDNSKNRGKWPYTEIGLVDMAQLNYEGENNSTVGTVRVNYDHKYKEYYLYSELDSGARKAIDNLRESLGLRRNDKVYEDEYVTSWEVNENNSSLYPTAYEKIKEKCRQVQAEESNIYNLTQTIAETFGVYCKYKFHYDDNYHIIGKEVIFYNNFSDEINGIIDLTYPYDTSSITRTLDGNDICTKLIVKNVEDENAPAGVFSIMNTAANKSGEDYILNFDYLYETGSIDKDQYDEISVYEAQMRKYNTELLNLSEEIIKLEEEETECKATVSITAAERSQALDQISQARSGLEGLTKNESGTIEKITPGVLKKEADNSYSIALTEKGIIFDSAFKVGKKNNSGNLLDLVTITEANIKKDSNNNIIGLKNLSLTASEQNTYTVWYVKFNYRPQLYYENIINTYALKWQTADDENNKAQNRLDEIEAELEKKYEKYEEVYEEKEKKIASFERMMGPALREGYWQADNYKDYGNRYSSEFKINSIIGNNELFVWDEEPFDDELLPYYETGVNLDKTYYPCVKLTDDILKKIATYISSDSKLCYKYQEVMKPTFEYTKSGDTFSYTLPGGKTYTANSLEELETKILIYGLSMITEDKSEDDIHLEDYTSSIKNDIRSQYGLTVTYDHFFVLNSTMQLGFVQEENIDSETQNKTYKVIPVLVLTGAEDVNPPRYYDSSVNDYVSKTVQEVISVNPQLCTVEVSVNTLDYEEERAYINRDGNKVNPTVTFSDYNNVKVDEVIQTLVELNKNDDFLEYNETKHIFVYPRIKIDDLSLKTSDDELTIYSNTTKSKLEPFYDYSVLIRDNSYYITLNPLKILNNGDFKTGQIFNINYAISNAELNIYLDALEISKTNAYPQVSYEVDISMMNTKFINTAYKQLNRIAHINDYELKFENVMGYISDLDLDLDHPWEDGIEIKNYKTKFEDLFTKIVASTEQMKANAEVYNKAASAFTSDGIIKSEIVSQSLIPTDLNLALNRGSLTIDKVDGIRAESADGVVLMSGGGIFCANEKVNGEWQWHSGILPSGINASLLKAGQIDTNLIRIYSGDNLRFQMNGDGLFAYKDGTNQKDYVVHNSDGLFLVNEIDEQNKINRVEVSWEGFIIRNNNNEKVFYADTDGNLTLAGTIEAADGLIGGWEITSNGLTSNPYEAADNNNSNNNVTIAGIASGILSDESNLLDNNTGLYKVFWAGDNSSDYQFYVDSTGVVRASSIIIDNSLIANKIVLDGILLNDVIEEVRDNTGSISVINLTDDTFHITGDVSTSEEEFLRFAIVSNSTVNLNTGESFTFYYLESSIEEETNETIVSSDSETTDTNNENANDINEEESENEESEEENRPNIIEEWKVLNPVGADGSGYYTLGERMGDHYLTFSINDDIISMIPEDASSLTLKVSYGIYEALFTINVRDERVKENLTVIITSNGGNKFELGKNDLTLKAIVYRDGERVIDTNNYSYQWYKINNENSTLIDDETTDTLVINADTDGIGTYSCVVRGD